MSNPCVSIAGDSKQQKEAQAIVERLKGLSNKWFKNDVIKTMTNERHRDFVTFYEEILPHLNFELSRLPNTKELNLLERKMNKYLSEVEKAPSKLGTLFKLPENILKKYPVTKTFFDDVLFASNFYRGNMEDVSTDLALISKNLNIATGHNTVLNKYGWGRNKAQKWIAKKEAEWKKLRENGETAKADELYDRELADLNNQGSTAKALNSLWELMGNPDLLLTDRNNLNLRFGPELVEAARIWHTGVEGRRPLKKRLWSMLSDGLKNNIEMLKKMEANEFTAIDFQIKKLEQLYTDYFDPKYKNLKYDKNYFPRQVLDIAPTFAKLSDDIHSGYADKNPQDISRYIDRMVEDVVMKLKMPGAAYERSIDTPTRVSKDVIDIMNTYAHNVMRFNYNARVTKATQKALQDLNTLEGPQFDQHIKTLTDYVMQTHDSALGLKFRNSKLSSVSRAITSWQFLSKLGLNVRTVARNATQSLQNWVYFGNKAIYEAMFDISGGDMKQMLSTEMKRHGYEFVNIQEFAQPKELMANLKIDDTGKVVESGPSTGAVFNDYLQQIASVTGKPMQWVENHVNRGLTFKLAFSERYNALTSNPAIIQKALNRTKKRNPNDKFTTESQEVMAEIQKIKQRMASNYAAKVVKELHYLYDPWAKPQILQGPVGSILGQFSTYSINFFEYQRKIAANAGNDILAGAWNSPEAFRLYRLGMLYTAVTGLGAITNAKWSNLIQNDTYERLSRLDQYLRGDKEAKEKAFFGKDPITATFGGPFVSDIIKLGQIVNFQ